eukprot:TRINITY_DN2514_c0_g1_i1.p1 TRINITY_DN2514_c0_g1~~TRINITY_DN2514_c0_g1_i1.p1  ORF type:complete len:478 (-),score=72.00 TRINITY_DN2514_c0_g1_i1:842-2275(-)
MDTLTGFLQPMPEQPQVELGRQFFVGGITPETSEEDLQQYFSQFGQVYEARVLRDKLTTKSRGFAFVTMRDSPAVLSLPEQDHFVNGKSVEVKNALPGDSPTLQAKGRRVFVGALPPDITVEELATHFGAFGRIIKIALPHDKTSGKFQNCCFVTYDRDESVEAAIRHPHHEFRSKVADVKPAEPRYKDLPWAAQQQLRPPVTKGKDVTGMYFVGGLNKRTTAEELRAYFSTYGSVKSAKIICTDGKSRGFGFVTFEDDETPLRNGLLTHTHVMGGMGLDVKSAVPEDELTTVLRTKRVFVGALPGAATEEMLMEHFQQFGQVEYVEIVYDKTTGKPKGAAFVTFKTEDHAENAVRHRQHVLLGKEVDVKKAEPRRKDATNITLGLQPSQPKRPKPGPLPGALGNPFMTTNFNTVPGTYSFGATTVQSPGAGAAMLNYGGLGFELPTTSFQSQAAPQLTQGYPFLTSAVASAFPRSQ